MFVVPTSAQARTPLLPDQGRYVDHAVWNNPSGAVGVRSFLGIAVNDSRGDDIGTIDGLLVDPDGAVTHALVAIGPFANLTERKIVVPWRDVTTTTVEEHVRKAPARPHLVARIDDRVLATALRFDPEVSARASPRARR